MEGSYTYTSSEGYDEFLGIRGVPWIVRKMILAAPVELKVSAPAMSVDVQLYISNVHYVYSLLIRCLLGKSGQWLISHR